MMRRIKLLLGSFFLLALCTLTWRYWSSEVVFSRDELVGRNDLFFYPIKIRGFSCADIPLMQVAVENQKVRAQVDLGFQGELMLPESSMKLVRNKRLLKMSKSYGLRGKFFDVPVYEVAMASLQNYRVQPIEVEEMNLQQEAETSLVLEEGHKKIKKDLMGRVGWQAFRDFGLLVDCRRKTMALCSGLESLPRKYSKRSFASVPLILRRGGLEFEAETVTGKWRCILDTGCTYNMVTVHGKAGGEAFSFDIDDECEEASFKVGGEEFGPMLFSRIETPWMVDAILGMEFFKEHVVFIDFPNEKLYFLKK